MNKLAYLASVGLVFVIGFYVGQQYSETAQPATGNSAQQDETHTKMIASRRTNHLPEDHIAGIENTFAARKQKDTQPQRQDQTPLSERSPTELTQSLKRAGMPEEHIKPLPPPPHQQSQGAELAATAQPSPEDDARQDEMNHEMIASMRANHLPEDHIAGIENALAARKQKDMQPQSQDQTPLSERSPAELAAELVQSLKQAGAPEEHIEAMVQRLYPQVADGNATQENAEPAANPGLPPMPDQPGSPR